MKTHNQYQHKAISVVKEFIAMLDDIPIAKQYFNTFPRDMHKTFRYGLEIPVEKMPNLTLRNVHEYLYQISQGVWNPSNQHENRELFGLLHIGPPTNIVFIKAGLSDTTERYVIAHELGHYLADILIVKQQWLNSLSNDKQSIQSLFSWNSVDGVLNLQALIRGLPARTQDISGRGVHLQSDALEHEIMADLIGRELLAPWELASSFYHEANKATFTQYLNTQFGLPNTIGEQYYEDIDRENNNTDFLDQFFSSLLK